MTMGCDTVGDESSSDHYRRSRKESLEMTREEAYSRCPLDSYVVRYGKEWLIVPYAAVEQPLFFVCRPGSESVFV
jgi:hypothetical protein